MQSFLSPRGTRIAVGSYNGLTRVYDVSSGSLLLSYQGPDTVKTISFLEDENQVVVGGADGHLSLLDIGQADAVKLLSGLYLINGLSWSEKRQELVTVGRDRIARRWNRNLELIDEIQIHTRSVKSVAWNPGGNFYATASYDSQVGIHSTNSTSARYAGGHRKPGVSCLAWLDDEHVVSGGWDGTIRIWNCQGQEQSCFTLGVTSRAYQ